MFLDIIKPMSRSKILLVGGHLSPILAILPELIKQKYQLAVAGRTTTFNDIKEPSLEYQILHRHPQLHFYSLNSGRFTQGEWLKLPFEFFRLLKALFKADWILKKEKPDLILSFGGYLSLPICVLAKLKNIKIRLHEQTINPGRANRLIALLAEKIFVAFPDAVACFSKNKTTVLGIALRDDYKIKNRPNFFKPINKPLLLIMGGSSGSHSINVITEKLLPKLTKSFQVVHQIGDNRFKDYKRLQPLQSDSYYPLKYLLPQTIGYFYHQTDLIVSRSGANTFFELINFQKPAVLIPLPWSANQEQLIQAKILTANKVAYLFNQNEPSDNLYQLIIQASQQLPQLKKNYQTLDNYAQLIKTPGEFLNRLLA